MTKASETSGGNKPNFENRTLFHGDNLDFLRGMNSETVHLIATDPPFNKGRDFHATPDSLAKNAKFQDRWSWERDIHGNWVDQIRDDNTNVWKVVQSADLTWGKDMAAFLCYMGVRLMEMHRILRSDGSLYLHCDPTASHYLKMMLDAIFGRKNFRNEIAWCYTGPSGIRKDFPRKHDLILRYAKGDSWTFNSDEVRIPYKADSFTMGGGRSLARKNKPGTDYRTGREEALARGKIVEDYWCDIRPLSVSKEYVGYPTQKPLALYERVIKASSNADDIVLDPFCGCATTPIAAERLGRQWIGMDIWDGAYDIVIQRFRDENLFVEDSMVAKGGLRLADVIYTKDPPERTDEGDEAAPYLQVRHRRPAEDWQRLSRNEIFARLEEAQAGDGGVVCGGCGRVLEREFMELDHITPRAARGENYITNRILLCVKCNSNKREDLTLIGLMKRNKKTGWMRDERRAKKAQRDAQNKAERIRDEGV